MPTAKELAEKIVALLPCSDENCKCSHVLRTVESLLTEALAEAKKQALAETYSQAFRDVRRIAYKECAEIAENFGGIIGACPECGNNSQHVIAQKIREAGGVK